MGPELDPTRVAEVRGRELTETQREEAFALLDTLVDLEFLPPWIKDKIQDQDGIRLPNNPIIDGTARCLPLLDDLEKMGIEKDYEKVAEALLERMPPEMFPEGHTPAQGDK